jgi:hypothetical protein
MIYVLFNKGIPVKATSETPFTGTPVLNSLPSPHKILASSTSVPMLVQVAVLASASSNHLRWVMKSAMLSTATTLHVV